MTKEEVRRRELLVKDDSLKLKEYSKVAKSSRLVQKKLIEELAEVDQFLTDWLTRRDQERKKLETKTQKRRTRKS